MGCRTPAFNSGTAPLWYGRHTRVLSRPPRCHYMDVSNRNVIEVMADTILVLNGPNLNMLGVREPGLYGAESLAAIEQRLKDRAGELGVAVDLRQSNLEGELVTWIQQALGRAKAIIINAGAYSHTSVAILDALRAVGLPVFEVHLSNIHQREHYRHHTYVSEIATGVICGLGGDGYLYALDAAVKRFRA